jgi:aspartyl-tRNA(Asn)/glutamyl-tRNA(Gln) amidotransferase subunit C
MKLERDDVLHIAKLARIALTDDEVDRYAGQLSNILGHFDVLDAVPTEGVDPTAHTLDLRNVMADDVARRSLPQEDVLKLAPRTEDGYLRVRAVLED